MKNHKKLCILSCQNFYHEIATAIAAENCEDVVVAKFPTYCGRPPVSWAELRPLLDDDCSQVIILELFCLTRLKHPPPNWPPVKVLSQEQCFHLIADTTVVANAIDHQAYLVTPTWLENWSTHLAEMGLSRENAKEFFKELVLLDTGINDSNTSRYLTELSAALDLPATRIVVGIDYTKLLANKIVMEWRLEKQKQQAHEHADFVTAMDFLSQLAPLTTEIEVIAAIKELFQMLFAPEKLYYLQIENGIAASEQEIPEVIMEQIHALDTDYAWLPNKQGFIIRIARDGQVLGLIVIAQLAFEDYREHYLNLALSIRGICGLAIKNTLTYRKLKTIENAQRLLSEITENVAEGVALIRNNDGKIHYVNKPFEDLFGYEKAELINQPMSIIYSQTEKMVQEISHTIETDQLWQGEILIQNKNGLALCISASVSQFQHPELGSLLIIYHLDISKQKQTEAQLQLATSVFSNAREAIVITDANANIIDVNESFIKITGYQRTEVLHKNPRILKSGLQSVEFYQTMWKSLNEKGHWHGEVWNRRKDGEVYVELLNITIIRDDQGHIKNYIGLFSDITSLKTHEQQLQHITHYDPLTDLPNRILLSDRLQQAMLRNDRTRNLVAVVFIDLDGFKEVNDHYGHHIGDELLICISNRMKIALREEDTLARIGGDEFVAVLSELDHIDDCKTIVFRLLKVASDPVVIKNVTVKVSASIGITLYPLDMSVADQLIRHADQAMYAAKQSGKNCYHIFDVELDSEIKALHDNINSIRNALNQCEFVLHYQPKVNMRTGGVIGAEALIRWQHPKYGLLLPSEFLPFIEHHPISVEVGEWVIKTALKQMSAWKIDGLYIPLSVNVAARHLQQNNFVINLSALLDEHCEVPPEHLELEILETSALSDLEKVSGLLKACRDIGVKFALDDFGTGYSSLTYLKHLPTDLIKIDQSFVRDMINDIDNLSIVKGIVGLASSFNRYVLAEGVETMEHAAILLALGCELGQGYGIAKPMPADDLPHWIDEWHSNNTQWNQMLSLMQNYQ